MDKIENSKSENEPRIIFDYFRVIKDLPGSYLELSSKIYNNLADPRYRYLFAVDLKHAYYTIPLYSNNRYYFAFTISGID